MPGPGSLADLGLEQAALWARLVYGHPTTGPMHRRDVEIAKELVHPRPLCTCPSVEVENASIPVLDCNQMTLYTGSL